MSEEMSFIRAIIHDWDDDTIRLIFADWLEDRGDPWSEYIRLSMVPNAELTADLEVRFNDLCILHSREWLRRLPMFPSMYDWTWRRGFPAYFAVKGAFTSSMLSHQFARTTIMVSGRHFMFFTGNRAAVHIFNQVHDPEGDLPSSTWAVYRHISPSPGMAFDMENELTGVNGELGFRWTSSVREEDLDFIPNGGKIFSGTAVFTERGFTSDIVRHYIENENPYIEDENPCWREERWSHIPFQLYADSYLQQYEHLDRNRQRQLRERRRPMGIDMP